MMKCPSEKLDKGILSPRTAADAVPDNVSHVEVSRLLPSWSDMVICYPTLEGNLNLIIKTTLMETYFFINLGYAALRHELTGSWLGDALVKVFSRHAHNTEFHSLMMKVITNSSK